MPRPKIFFISGRSYTNIQAMARPNNDHAHLRVLRDMYARMGCFPSYSRMAEALGFKAKNAAFKLTQRLIATGHLAKAAGGRLAPGPGFFTLDLSDDEVRAGFSAGGDATGLVQAQALNELLVTRPSRTSLVRVRGDSMVEAGILSGDVAVMEANVQAVHGDIVVAAIDGIATIKEFRTDRGRPYLKAHGIDMRAVMPRETLDILGIVRGVVRSYRPLLSSRKSKLTKHGKPQ